MKFSLLIVTALIAQPTLAASGWTCTIHSAGYFESTNDVAKPDKKFFPTGSDYTQTGLTKASALAKIQNICAYAFLDDQFASQTLRVVGRTTPASKIQDLSANTTHNIQLCKSEIPKITECEQVAEVCR